MDGTPVLPVNGKKSSNINGNENDNKQSQNEEKTTNLNNSDIDRSDIPISDDVIGDCVDKQEKDCVVKDVERLPIGKTIDAGFSNLIEKDASECSKPSSEILKGILESSITSYVSDVHNIDNVSKPTEMKDCLALEISSQASNKPNEDECVKDWKKISMKEVDKDEMKDTNSKVESDIQEEHTLIGSKDSLSKNVEKEENSAISQDNVKIQDRRIMDENRKISENKPSISNTLSVTVISNSITDPSSSTSNEQQTNMTTAIPNSDEQSNCDKSDKPMKYRCSKCSCVTKDKRLFENHSCNGEIASEEEKVKITIQLSKEKNRFICKECNFASSHGFEEHLMCHLMLRPYQCLYCKECFINRREISRHVIKSHNGAKMSCALRALRRAKGLIKEVTATGTLTFMARVAGKVPLEKDPEKKKNGTNLLKPKDEASNSSMPNPQKDQPQEAQDIRENLQETEEIREDDGEINNEENDPKCKTNAVPFSKLREVLTAENPLQSVEERESDETKSTNAETGEAKEQIAMEDQGLKIIASYSLQEETLSQEQDTHNEENNVMKNTKKSPQPNFFMVSSPPCIPEPEVLSFLGTEHQGLRQPKEQRSFLPPPSVQAAPLHSDDSMSSSLDTLQHSSIPAPVSIPVKPEKISNFFICSFNCAFNTISKSDFLDHLVHFHSTETSFTCYYCGHKSSQIEDVVNHMASHADSSTDKKKPLFHCSSSDCQFGSNMITDYINHVNTAHKDGNKPACNACVSVFSEVSLLQIHLEENIIHVVNCPHCPSKASERRAILNHISSEHPGKPKMVSVVKQLICRDKKMNGYERPQLVKEMLPPSLTPGPSIIPNSGQGTSVLDQILRRHDPKSTYIGSQSQCNSSIVDALLGSTNTSPRNTPSPASLAMSPYSSRKRGDTSESERSPASETSGFSGVRVKEEIKEIDIEGSKEIGMSAYSRGASASAENNSSYITDEHGVRRRLYVPMSERHAENFRCQFCTFVARDLKRLACHERSHGMPPTRKDRFKCMFCPQGFDSELKFRLHITCHPGLIKFLLYKCKKCEFDSNQKHTIVKHITCNRDRKHRGVGPVEDQYTIISRSLESRVLECEECDYMTRHKVHMAIHYQREHGILRDKNDFTIEGLTPSDTLITGSELMLLNERSPQHDVSPQFDPTMSLPANKKRKDSASSDATNQSMGEINERNELFKRLVSQRAALQPGHVLENQARKFKCPICKYLLPKAADLKNHVKRHSEIGQITLVMFRCKYCSCMSTARELLYDHLKEKHPGKSIALVKKIVVIDTTETDKSFAETSVEESLQQLEESVHKEIMTVINDSQTHTATPPLNHSNSSSTSFEQLFVIPQGEDTFQDSLQCPKCSYKSHHRDEIIQHVTGIHPEVKIISSDDDINKLTKSATKDLHRSQLYLENGSSPQASQEEVLIVPDEPTFKEMALCSRCDFSTMFRKDMVLHLQKHHPEISVMGRNSYPVQVSTMGSKLGDNVLDESCVVGSGSLDAKLKCLYENYGSQMKCLICGIERPKKFFIHVHILRHLNIYLWKCAFCSHRGLQKYKMVDHIKKIHPGHPMSVQYLRVNVESRVAQFMSQFNEIQNHPSLMENPESPEESMDQTYDDLNTCSSSTSYKPLQKDNTGSPHTLGSDELDEKISCLYDYSDGLFYKCLACNNQFQRKFAIHRHIIISHLKVALLSCSYCGMQGVEKHQMVDHIIACHQSEPVKYHTNDVDIAQAVSDFLAKASTDDVMGLKDDLSQSDVSRMLNNFASTSGSRKAEQNYKKAFSANRSTKFMNLGANFKFPLGAKLKELNSVKKKKTTGNKSKSIVDPGVIMLGREALDKELNSLYQVRPGGQFRCLICRWEFPRTYPLHRHMMLKHLRMNLVACPYCTFNGVEKYTVSTHIKEEHRGQPVSIKYIQPDVKSRVHQFLSEMASGSSTIKKRMSHSSSPPQPIIIKMKREKTSDFDKDVEEEEEDGQEEGDEDDEKKDEPTIAPQGLVVAMFGKKSKKTNNVVKKRNLNNDVNIKKEVEDDEYESGGKNDHVPRSQLNNDDNEEEEEIEEEEEESEENNQFSTFKKEDYTADDDDDEDDDAIDEDEKLESKSLAKFMKMESYAPGSYRSPSGGKPKALDVITKIKVLKSKEGPITKFYCEQCKFTSVHRSNIVRHIYKIHERYQTHTCPVCNYQTLSLMLMQTHMKKEHPGVEFKEDSFCIQPPRTKPRSRSLLNLGTYQRKKKYKPKIYSPKPSPFIPTPAPATSSELGPKQYACAYCHYETNTQEDILDHTREKHSQGFTNSEGTAKSNKRLEDKSKACWERSKKAVKRKVSEGSSDSVPVPVKRKFVFEKGDELIQCGHCDVRETSMGRIQHHMEWDHAGLALKFKRIPSWRFVCKTCAVKTMATSKMKYHLNRHVSYRPYTCVNCGAFFPSPDQCRRHARSNRHEEQYMYVRNAKKEQKVEELLQETRQLALQIQEEAFKDPNFDIANIDSFMSRFQNTKHNLKRTGSATGPRAAKKAKLAGKVKTPVRKQVGKSAQTVGIELNVIIKCYGCDFQANTINEVYLHHKKTHAGEEFFWTDMDRGFSCDITGEALPNCDKLPTSSEDVGYSTKISLSAGSNSTRFKCKSCDFSSSVIQAMKSHLKSHQPKGYVCAYCSRFFSGKEKLMRHQYCLHKGMTIWIIHLRKSSGSSATVTKSVSHIKHTAPDTSLPAEEDEEDEGEEQEEDEVPTRMSSNQLHYVCNECSFSSDSLLQYSKHLSKAHVAFRTSARDISTTSVCKPTEEEEQTHSAEEEANFQCGHCKFQAKQESEIEEHNEEAHSGTESQMLDLRSNDEIGESGSGSIHKKKLSLNLEPRVSMKRISSSTIAWYDDVKSENSDGENEDSIEEDTFKFDEMKTGAEDSHESYSLIDYDPDSQIGIENVMEKEDDDYEEEEEEDGVTEEGVSQAGYSYPSDNDEDGKEIIDEMASDDSSKFIKEEDYEEREEENMDEVEYEDNVDTEMNSTFTNNSDDMIQQSGLDNSNNNMTPPSLANSEPDMMIMAFDSVQRKRVPANTLDIATNQITNTPGFGVDEEGENSNSSGDEDEGEFDFYENNVTLASPLPMISLGDGVTMSPDITVNTKFDETQANVNEQNSSSEKEIYDDSESLLDI